LYENYGKEKLTIELIYYYLNVNKMLEAMHVMRNDMINE